MGFFSRKKLIGSMKFSFITHTSVVVEDLIPDTLMIKNETFPAVLYFSFLCVARLLFNFPQETGRYVCADASNNLSVKINSGDFLDGNYSLLGSCCLQPLQIVNSSESAILTYMANFCKISNGLIVDTKIAFRDADYFHRAVIDTVLEIGRRRLKEKGDLICLGSKTLFDCLYQKGCRNLGLNYQYAMAITTQNLMQAGLIKI